MADDDSREGTRYADSHLLQFVARLHAGHDAGMQRAFDAPKSTGLPAIQVSQSEGRLLELLVRLSGARRIVEVGTLAGYSALRMATAMPADGRLWTLEVDGEHAAVARANLEAAGMAGRVDVVVGPALATLDAIAEHGPFDLVFLDADKAGYASYGRWAHAHLRPGGLLVADNAYLFGRLLEASETAAEMRRFHEETALTFESVCVPTPDGLVIAIRP